MITIIDYGLGNLASIQNMLNRIGVRSTITDDITQIGLATKIILPGVGAFDNGMKCIEEKGLLPILNTVALEKKIPVLGICLGMQLLTRGSEEGKLKGLSWIEADTVKFNFAELKENLRIPHMGWNNVTVAKDHPITFELEKETKFYFVHSFHVKCDSENDVLMKCNYGFDFTCAIQKDNIIGMQFHPEKSHKFGMQVMKRFAELN